MAINICDAVKQKQEKLKEREKQKIIHMIRYFFCIKYEWNTLKFTKRIEYQLREGT